MAEKFERLDIGIAVLAYPLLPKSVYTIGGKLVKIFSSIVNKTIFISGKIPESFECPDEVIIRDVNQKLYNLENKSPLWFFVILWYLKNLFIQILMAIEVFRHFRQIDIVCCFLGAQYQIPILVSKILGIRVICGAAGIGGDFAKHNFGSFWGKLASISNEFNFALSDIVVIESWRLADIEILSHWKSKLRHGALFLDYHELFDIQVPLNKRKNCIGYIGRLSPEKGVKEFMMAIPHVLRKMPSIEIAIIGSGVLDSMVDELLDTHWWGKKVKRYHWVDHIDLPTFYNNLKLIILPSKTEGIPNVILEAFGCGTPVIASPVGGVPDIVIDGKTGFHLHDTSPKAFAERIFDVMQDEILLAEVVSQARELLLMEYYMNSAVKRYFSIVKELVAD